MKVCFLGNSRSEGYLRDFEAKYGQSSPTQSDFIVCIGGDGFLLSMMRKYWKEGKPFYGLDNGKEGFLMNSCSVDSLYQSLETGHRVTLFPLNAKVISTDGREEEILAFNEVYMMRSSPQAAQVSLHVDQVPRLEKMICDGVLVATPMGSTAYNLSVGGSIVPLETNALICTPINPFRPRRLASAVLSGNSTIELKPHDIEGRPVYFGWDNMSIQGCSKAVIEQDKAVKVSLVFNSNSSLQERVMREQFLSP